MVVCFLIALFLAFFEKTKKLWETVARHEKNWRLTGVITKQKINFVVAERIK